MVCLTNVYMTKDFIRNDHVTQKLEFYNTTLFVWAILTWNNFCCILFPQYTCMSVSVKNITSSIVTLSHPVISDIRYTLGAQPYDFEPHWLTSNIFVAHSHVWQFYSLVARILLQRDCSKSLINGLSLFI